MTTIDASAKFDIAPLLAPIAGEHAAGEWLRFDGAYDDIRKLRESDDPSLPQGVWKRELKRADWPGVAGRTAAALATKSKDLQLAVWLTEAWLHTGGFAGFAAGMSAIAQLCDAFWDELYPPLGEGRFAPLAWAADKLVLPLESVAVTNPATEDATPLTWSDRKRALYYQNLEESHPEAATSAYQSGAPTVAQFSNSVAATKADWYTTLARDVAAARAAVDAVDSTLARHSDDTGVPNFGPLIETLDAIGAFAGRVVAERVHVGEIAPPSHEKAALFAEFPASNIASRAEAFQHLREAAGFLVRSEPHSPVPYLVMRAVAWEHMPLPQLLAELLQKSDLDAVYALLGMDKQL